jgi:hypothetical protein
MNNERGKFTINDAILWASERLIDKPVEDISPTITSIERFLSGRAESSFDAEKEKNRFINNAFYDFEVECEINRLYVAEDFIEFFDEWYNRKDEILSHQSSQYAMDKRKVLEDITLSEIAKYAKGEYDRHYDIMLHYTDEDSLSTVVNNVELWHARAQLVEDAVELDRSGYGPRHENVE